MFSFKFIKKLTAQTGVIRIPNQIRDSLRIDGKDESGVFIPKTVFTETFRDNCVEKNELRGIAFSNSLLCSIDRFHKPESIFREIASESPGMLNQLPSFDTSFRPDIGGGINVFSGMGFHELISNYLLIDKNDHSQWFSLISIDRTIRFAKNMTFQINKVRCYIRPNYEALEDVYMLTGSMVGDLVASELESIAYQLKAFDLSLETVFDFKSMSCEDNFGLFSGIRNELSRNIKTVNEEPEFFSPISLMSFA